MAKRRVHLARDRVDHLGVEARIGLRRRVAVLQQLVRLVQARRVERAPLGVEHAQLEHARADAGRAPGAVAVVDGQRLVGQLRHCRATLHPRRDRVAREDAQPAVRRLATLQFMALRHGAQQAIAERHCGGGRGRGALGLFVMSGLLSGRTAARPAVRQARRAAAAGARWGRRRRAPARARRAPRTARCRPPARRLRAR